MSFPAVFVPGSLCDSRVFRKQLRDLDADCRVADVTLDASIDAMAERLLRSAPLRFTLVGLSLGGIVAAEVIRRAPDRVRGLALIDTNLAPPDRRQIDNRRRWAAAVRSGQLALVIQELVPTMTVAPERHGQLITEMARSVGPAGFLRQNAALLDRPDRRSVLCDVEVPTTIVCGAEDAVCPPALHADLAERTPHAKLTVVADAGHLSTIDQPAALTSAIADWLELCNTNQPRRGTTHECTTA